MGFNESFARSLGGHRNLIREQQAEIEKLKSDFLQLEDATTQIFQADVIKSTEDNVVNIRSKQEAFQNDIGDELESIKADILDLKHNPEVSVLRFDELDLRLTDIDNKVSEIKKLRRKIHKLRESHGDANLDRKKYQKSWRNLFLFSLFTAAVSLLGVERSYGFLENTVSWLPSLDKLMLTGGLVVLMLLFFILEDSAWSAVSRSEREGLRFFENHTTAKIVIIVATFIYAVGFFWGSMF